MEKRITGNEPFHSNQYSVHDKGITIYQEALLRFMVEIGKRYVDIEDAAEEAERMAIAYIKRLNDGRSNN